MNIRTKWYIGINCSKHDFDVRLSEMIMDKDKDLIYNQLTAYCDSHIIFQQEALPSVFEKIKDHFLTHSLYQIHPNLIHFCDIEDCEYIGFKIGQTKNNENIDQFLSVIEEEREFLSRKFGVALKDISIITRHVVVN